MRVKNTTGCKCDICGKYFTSKDVYEQTYETIRTRRKTTLFIHKECIRRYNSDNRKLNNQRVDGDV